MCVVRRVWGGCGEEGGAGAVRRVVGGAVRRVWEGAVRTKVGVGGGGGAVRGLQCEKAGVCQQNSRCVAVAVDHTWVCGSSSGPHMGVWQ